MEQGDNQGFFFPGAAQEEDGDAQASETTREPQTVQMPAQTLGSESEPNYALWLWYLYFRPKRFFEGFVVEPMPFLTALCAWIYGMAAVIDRIAMQQMQGRSAIAMDWGLYMSLVAGMGIVGGAMQYLIGGWWYRVRLVWSNAEKPDPGLARRVYVYASQVAAIPIVLMTLGQATVYRTPGEMIEANSVAAMTVALVVMLCVLWSVWTSYSGVTTLFPSVSLGRARTWFLILPGLIYSAVFALVFLATVVTGVGQTTEPPDLENPEIYRSGVVRFGYPGNWEVIRNRPRENIMFSIHIKADQRAMLMTEVFHSKALPEEELALVVSGLRSEFGKWREEYLALRWGSLKGVGVKAVADIGDEPYRFSVLIVPLAPGRFMEIRQVVLIEHEALAQPGFDLIERSFKISRRLLE